MWQRREDLSMIYVTALSLRQDYWDTYLCVTTRKKTRKRKRKKVVPVDPPKNMKNTAFKTIHFGIHTQQRIWLILGSVRLKCHRIYEIASELFLSVIMSFECIMELSICSLPFVLWVTTSFKDSRLYGANQMAIELLIAPTLPTWTWLLMTIIGHLKYF